MARLIDADRFLKTTRFQEGRYPHNDIVEDIESQPTVDAVPVVLCKDCKHYVWDEFDGSYACLSIGRFVKPDFWCAHGERRTDG